MRYHLFLNFNRKMIKIAKMFSRKLAVLRYLSTSVNIVPSHFTASNDERERKQSRYYKGSRRSREIIKYLVHRPRRSFYQKQVEEHNLGSILIFMSALFIFCQSFKIIPDMYEIFQCHQLGKYGGNCEMNGPVCIFSILP